MLKELTGNGILDQTTYLGPATILAVEERRVHLECPDCFPWARVALAQSYQPVKGDVVLAVGRGQDWYVIGLLEGTGVTTFTAPGDLALRAPCGKIELQSGQGIILKSPLVEIFAGKLEMAARQVFQRFTDLTQWISGALHGRFGRVNTKVETDYHLNAGRIVERAEGDMIVNGKMIHLN